MFFCIYGWCVGLFFLGHMAWGVVFAVVFAGKRERSRLLVPLVLISSVLPDLDLFIGDGQMWHHTFTHSLFFWFVLFVPFLWMYRLKVIPYFVAVVQHFAFGDFLVGDVMLFWPFISSFFGFNTAMMSWFDVGLEMVGLILAIILLFYRGYLRELLSVDRNNVLMFIPFLAVVASMLFLAVDFPIVPLIAHVWGSARLFVIGFGHLVLTVFLGVSVLQGLRKL